jgi:hypothetical protein
LHVPPGRDGGRVEEATFHPAPDHVEDRRSFRYRPNPSRGNHVVVIAEGEESTAGSSRSNIACMTRASTTGCVQDLKPGESPFK